MIVTLKILAWWTVALLIVIWLMGRIPPKPRWLQEREDQEQMEWLRDWSRSDRR